MSRNDVDDDGVGGLRFGRLTSSTAPLMTGKFEDISGPIIEKANLVDGGLSKLDSSNYNGGVKRNTLKIRDARSYKKCYQKCNKAGPNDDFVLGKLDQPPVGGRSSTSANVSEDDDTDVGQSSIPCSKRRRLDNDSLRDSPSAARSPQDKDGGIKDKALVGKEHQTPSFAKECAADIKSEELHLSAKIDDGHNACVGFQCNRFAEYWVPAKLSNLQLEQYCSTLLLNSSLLYSSLKTDADFLRDVITSARKCCVHPYLLDQSLKNTITKDLTPEDKLNVEIQASGKLKLLDEILLESKKRGLRLVILFQLIRSNSVDTNGNILDDLICQRFGEDSYVRIDGEFPRATNQASVDKFNDIKSGRFIILVEDRACKPSIKLSAVDVVILFDSSWNPQNDLKALQRITICSKSEELKVFRLYSSCTVEEKFLILAKKGMVVANSNCSSNWKIYHTLLTWGASNLFSKLDEFHGCRDSAAVSNISPEQSFLSVVLSELLAILNCSGESGHSTKESFITKVTLDESGFTTKSSFGEKVTEQIGNESPTRFWTNLLRGRFPIWKILSESSPRSRKKVVCIDNPVRESEFECDRSEMVKVANFNDCHGHRKRKWKNQRNINTHGKKREIAASKDLTVAERTSSSSDERNDINQITTSVEPGIAELCRLLQLPENVRGTAVEFLGYITTCFKVIWKEVATSQAFQISVCWVAAALLEHKIDRTEWLNRAKLHLNFICQQEEADHIFSELQSLKEEFTSMKKSDDRCTRRSVSSDDQDLEGEIPIDRSMSSDQQEFEEGEIPTDRSVSSDQQELEEGEIPDTNETSSPCDGQNFVSAGKETSEVLEGLCGEVVRDDGPEKITFSLHPIEEKTDLVLENATDCEINHTGGLTALETGQSVVKAGIDIIEGNSVSFKAVPMGSRGDNIADQLVPGTNETSSCCDGHNSVSFGLCGEVARDGPEKISGSLQPNEETLDPLVPENLVDCEINLSGGLTALETSQSVVAEAGIDIVKGNPASSREDPVDPPILAETNQTTDSLVQPVTTVSGKAAEMEKLTAAEVSPSTAPNESTMPESMEVQHHLSKGQVSSCSQPHIPRLPSIEEDPADLSGPLVADSVTGSPVQPLSSVSVGVKETQAPNLRMQQLPSSTATNVSTALESMETEQHPSNGRHASSQEAQNPRVTTLPVQVELPSPAVTNTITNSSAQPVTSVAVREVETQAENLRIQELPDSTVPTSVAPTVEIEQNRYDGRHAFCQEAQVPRRTPLEEIFGHCSPMSNSPMQPSASIPVGENVTRPYNPLSRNALFPPPQNLPCEANDTRVLPQYPDPLLAEIERIRRLKAEASKLKDNTIMQLRSEYEKEMAEKVAQIRNKYELLRGNAEAAHTDRQKDLEAQSNKVLLNQLLATTLRFSHSTDTVLMLSNQLNQQAATGTSVIGMPLSLGYGSTQFTPVSNHSSTRPILSQPVPFTSFTRLQDSSSRAPASSQFMQVLNHSLTSPIAPCPATIANYAGLQNSEVRAVAPHLRAPSMPRPPLGASNGQTPVYPENATANYRMHPTSHNQLRFHPYRC